MALPVAAIALAAVGAATAISGAIQKGKARREAKRLRETRPKLPVSPYAQDNLKLAQSELARGMSPEAERAYQQSTDRAYATSLDAILKGGGSVNNIGALFDATDQGRQRLALARENIRLNQINNLVAANQYSDSENQNRFKFNQWAPWADASQANAQFARDSNEQMWQGIGTVGSAIGMMGNSSAGSNMGRGVNLPSSSINTTLMPTNTNGVGSTGYSSPATTFANRLPSTGSINPSNMNMGFYGGTPTTGSLSYNNLNVSGQ